MKVYKVIRQIGGGGYGEVFQCSHNGRTVAKKIQFALPAVDAERFKKEVRILTRLNHPNIVTVLDANLDSQPYWFVMPYYDKSLKDILGELPGDVKRSEQIFGKVLDGVQYAHANHVLHRDLKPGNILLNDEEDVVVADFGLGRQTTSDSARLTRTTASLIGTIEYMAPEQRAGLKNSDHRSDIFSLGVILYEMYTGEESYLGAHDFSRLPIAISPIVRKCMDRNVEKRFQSVAELKEALSKAIIRQADYSSQGSLRSIINRIKEGEIAATDSTEAMRLIANGPELLEEYHEVGMELPVVEFAHALRLTPDLGLVVVSRFCKSTQAKQSYDFRYVDKIVNRLGHLHKAIASQDMRAELVKCILSLALEWDNFTGRAIAANMLSRTKGQDETADIMEYLPTLSTEQMHWLNRDESFRKLHDPFGPYFSVNV